ncbi:MAG: 30S ribosomal protein S3 [Candidatus Cloacimonadota bacterium]|uniref:Small ribosomal subunit protein uS3 n=1 Tax=Cloacimonas acidaminovorans (strain Evry) TaxID=459349 RepID=B0VI25_CLOAI|nr:30S ribosomal protein S3 [Candidatus Cloacimonas acidaminovorans]MBP8704397.1 30S ribosomal protein S3 [Candidatus Cloacimonas sp.]MDI9571940.1 30S ribosomal protein S3 [Candidatus Cloacimonadota bacterium]OQC72927.1 MAG: 30S ribosomal protein S3 [Candidatus Cloacimonetes bacterium ADurb.Bin003]MDD3605674.1 30S ribosomal protein S3 [Candidatus Cloacimonas acidaminovorans]MDD5407316.1 30S ribosomal protein S3 [Candidatus Cloacimonas acidaminovorans]
MGQKIHPVLYRLGVNKETESIWFAQGTSYVDFLQEDIKIRNYIRKRLSDKMVSRVQISRKTSSIIIDIYTARPGLVIGKKGEDIDKLRNELNVFINKDRKNPISVSINIEPIDKMWLDARLVAQEIARQLEERISFRRAMKMAIRYVMKENAQGVKVQVSGRLGGAEIARSERYKQGRTPLHTLRADIDYANVEANTTYGVIGVKVWIYKGDILD